MINRWTETINEENKKVVESWKEVQKTKPSGDDGVSKEMMKDISPEEALAS